MYGQELESVYSVCWGGGGGGVNISADHNSNSSHISEVTNTANSTVGLAKRNERLFTGGVHVFGLELYIKENIEKIKMNQGRAAS